MTNGLFQLAVRLLARRDVRLLLLFLQLVVYVLRLIFASELVEPVAYQRF